MANLRRILVTGGAGFIGSHLVKSLLKSNHKIYVIDNFNNYYDPEIKRANVRSTLSFINQNNIKEENYTLFEGDIRDRKLLDQVFSQDIELVVHLAAMAGVRYSIEEPRIYYDVNINGTLNLLEFCKDNEIKKFIFASSSSVYGNNKKVPFSENDSVDNPISPYAATKKAGELLCHTFYHLYGISIACLRFFTVYGPGQRPDLAIHKFTSLISEGREIPFYGDGSSKRDYTYVEDIIDGISRTINWIDYPDVRYEIFNLGEANLISLNKMVQTIENKLGIKAKLKLLPSQPGDVDMTFADINKSKKILGYNPSTNFDTGVEEFIKWYKSFKNEICCF